MIARSQIGGYVQFESARSAVSIGIDPASIRRHDAHAIVFEVGDRTGDLSSGVPLLRVASVLELALIAVLFVLISGLVGLRLAEELSGRDVELPPVQTPLRSMSTAASVQEDGGMETNSSPTDDHQQPFEHSIAPETPSELLSDEGEVVRLLVANHGRLHQHEIADETGWSKSKVSRICSRMDSDGTIEKASLGRENVITLSERSTDRTLQSADVENQFR